MSTDDFEQRLQRLPQRPIPEEWREQILAAASEASKARGKSGSADNTRLSLVSTLRSLLWPCPKAWAGLAAAWLVIAALNLASAPHASKIAQRSPLPQTLVALREQERLLAELLQQPEPHAPEPPKRATPRPRSERRKTSAAV